jgi:hypothetical protein
MTAPTLPSGGRQQGHQGQQRHAVHAVGQRFGMATVAAKREGLGSAPAKDSEGSTQALLCRRGLERHTVEATSKAYLSNARVLSVCPIRPTQRPLLLRCDFIPPSINKEPQVFMR